jgi:hypothetical protein
MSKTARPYYEQGYERDLEGVLGQKQVGGHRPTIPGSAHIA